MINIILLGAPGSGKGTQAENMGNWYGIPQVATGEIFRSNIKAGTDLGRMANGYLGEGKLVPDEITIGLVKSRISEEDCVNGFILDGFPRNIAQAEALEAFLAENGRKISVVASIYLPDETIVERLAGRRLCGECQKPYHTKYNPPIRDGACDACGGAIVQRDDDREETIRNRLSVYHAQTAPLIERYGAMGLFVQVTGRELVEDTTSEMRAALKNALGR
jgi:adenylate kinase